MTELISSNVAGVIAIVALIVAFVALRRVMKPLSGHEDQPITMSGGSLKNQSGWWDVNGNKGTYKSKMALLEVLFSCRPAVPARIFPFTAPFTIGITFTDPNDNSNFHTIDVECLNSKRIRVTETDRSGNAVAENYLNVFLNHGEHPEAWIVTRITSTGGIALDDCGTSADHFYLKLKFKP